MSSHQDEIARALADALAPVVAARLSKLARTTQAKLTVTMPRDLERAVNAVTEASIRLEQARHTREEIPTRRLLEARAKALRQVVERMRP